MRAGRLITLEGGEGAGKSTLLQGLRVHLGTYGIEPVLTREPGGTPLGEVVRTLVLDPAYADICAEAELLLMFAARAQLVRTCLQPQLKAGHWVICDRFTDASYAYQGAGRGQPFERIATLEHWATQDLQPDLTFLLDLPVEQGRARIVGRGPSDRIERESTRFFTEVRAAYRARAVAFPERFFVLDASLPSEQVLAAASAEIDRRWKDWQ